MKSITFEEAIEEYLKYLSLNDKPQSVYKIKNRINNHILPYFENKSIKITRKDYLEWQYYINSKNLKYNYKKTLHYCFVAFLNHCVKYYGLKENVGSIVGNFKNNEIEETGNIWTIEEFNNFISLVDNKMYNILFKTLYFTGCRLGELLALNFNDIDLINNTININKTITKELYNNSKLITTPKTKKSNRKIYIDSKLANELNELKQYYINTYKEYNNNFFVFGGINSLSHTTITRKKNYYCKKANIKQIKIHEFRHSHACLLYQNNIDIEDIKYRLGHSSISMTIDVYLKNLPHNEKRVIKTLDSLRLN